MPRLFLALCLGLQCCHPSFADEKDRTPNTLTKQEIADGWILLFDGETTFGWKVEGEARVEKGELVLGGEKETTVKTGALPNGTLYLEVLDAAPQYRFKTTINGVPTVVVPPPQEGGMTAGGGKYNSWEVGLGGNKVIAATVKDMDSGRLIVGFGPALSAPDSTAGHKPLAPGGSELGFQVPAGHSIRLKNVRFKPSGQESVFNGKDLAGWKAIEGKNYKSKFSVTEKGELNIKDGGGDIQTEGEWDDFVLQLDIIANGHRLNSGVFFRCVPGQFWSGYEAQVRNDFLSEVQLNDGTVHSGHLSEKEGTYTVRLHEKQGDKMVPVMEPAEEGKRPRQKQLKIAKSEVKSVRDLREFPVDFGTGGLYNRQPARKVTSSDGEYFTMTVIAHGAHIAIWVNGYQTVDFTDTAKDAPSARQGRKLGKGPISLQGHDPTTDLSFKNIRVAPMAKAVNK